MLHFILYNAIITVQESGEIAMNVKSVFIDGFKNIDRVKIELNKITALLSPNNFGKSNLLTAIDFGFQFIQAPREDKVNMMGWKNGFPLNSNEPKDFFEFEVELEHVIDGEPHTIVYGYTFEWRKTKNFERGIVKENLKVKNDNLSQKLTTYIDRNFESKKFKTSPTGRCDRDIIADSGLLIVNKLLAYDDLYYLNDVVKPLNEMNFYLDKHFDTRSSYEVSPIVRRGADDLSLNTNHDIARVLFKLKQRHEDKFNLIVNTLKGMFSFIENINIVESVIKDDTFLMETDEEYPFILSDRFYTLFAKHTNLVTPINFAEMSDGVKRVLLLLTHIVLAEINHVILIGIEEPENSINPGLLRKYLIVLDNFIDTSKIIITSHSPFLVNYLNPYDIYLGIPNEIGTASFSRVRKTSIKKLYDEADHLDMPFGEFLFDLLSGTDEDYQVLKRYL